MALRDVEYECGLTFDEVTEYIPLLTTDNNVITDGKITRFSLYFENDTLNIFYDEQTHDFVCDEMEDAQLAESIGSILQSINNDYNTLHQRLLEANTNILDSIKIKSSYTGWSSNIDSVLPSSLEYGFGYDLKKNFISPMVFIIEKGKEVSLQEFINEIKNFSSNDKLLEYCKEIEQTSLKIQSNLLCTAINTLQSECCNNNTKYLESMIESHTPQMTTNL